MPPINDAAPVFKLTVYKPSTPPTRKDAKPIFVPFASVKMSNPTKSGSTKLANQSITRANCLGQQAR